MTQTIQLKRSSVATKVPLTSELALGEVAVNTFDGKMYFKKDNGTESIVEVTSAAQHTLTLGNNLTGGSFDGSADVTVNVTANSANVASSIVSRDAVGNFNAGTITASLNGNASSVTNGVYTSDLYSNPSWLTSLAGSKITGNIPGSAASLSAVLSVSLGGTGGSTSATGINNLLPSQASHAGSFLTTDGSNVAWSASAGTTNPLTFGNYLTGGPTFDGSVARTIAVNATNLNTASTVVARDSSGNFSAGTITATLNGNATNVNGIVPTTNGGTGLSTIGTSLQLLRVNATATGLEFFTASGGVGSPGGSSAQIQYNSGGIFGGSSIETDGNNLIFVGSGRLLQGDMTSASATTRFSIQTSTVNSDTKLNIIPNGTSTTASVFAINKSVPSANYAYFNAGVSSTESFVESSVNGPITVLPLSFKVASAVQSRVLPVVGAVNYVTISGGVTTTNPIIGATGSDTNVSLSLVAKGSGAVQVDTNGTNAIFKIGGSTLSTGDASIEVGTGRTGNGTSYIDLVGDVTFNDYGLRLIRNNTGSNATSQLIHRGSGDLSIEAIEAAHILFNTTNLNRLSIDADGNVVVGVGALSTSATNGFLYIPTTPGVPSGTPTTYTGRSAVVYDTTDNALYGYNPVNTVWENLTGSGGASSTPGGAQGSVQFNNSSAFAGSTNLIWDNVNSRLGINQAVPTVALDVVGAIKASSTVTATTLTSTQTTGTAPFTVTSTTTVSNLNADLLDGQHGAFYQNASNMNSGILPVSRGGTNLSAVGTINQILGVTTLGGALEYKNITGGTNTVISYSAGNITISGTSKGIPGGSTSIDSTGDPNFANVTLLAHFNGTNGSTVFTDVKGHSFTNANTVISTSQSKFGGASAFFNGTSARLDLAASSDFGFESSDFTIELAVYVTSLPPSSSVLIDMRAAEPDVAIMLSFNSSGDLILRVNGVDVITGAGALTTGAWYNIAIVKTSSATVLYKNAVQIGSTYTDNNFYGTTKAITLGDRFDTSHQYFNGFIDELRITKDIGRIITVPLAAYPDIQAKAKGSIQYNNSGNFYGDTAFVWDGINNRLGVNQATPLQAVHVVGNVKIEGSGNGVIFNDGTALTTAIISNVANGTITNTQISPRVLTVTYAPTVTLNWAIADVIKITLTGNIIITNSGAIDGQKCLLELTQDGTGNRTVAFTTETVSDQSVNYVASTTPNKTDRLGFVFDSPTTYTIVAALGSAVINTNNITTGTVILVAGTATVSNASITSTTRIFLTSQVDGGTVGFLRISSRANGISFTITSSSNTDTSTVAWMIA